MVHPVVMVNVAGLSSLPSVPVNIGVPGTAAADTVSSRLADSLHFRAPATPEPRISLTGWTLRPPAALGLVRSVRVMVTVVALPAVLVVGVGKARRP